MQWREGRGRFQFLQDPIVNEAMLTKLRSTMHYTMTDGVGCRQAGLGKHSHDSNDRLMLGSAAIGQIELIREQQFGHGIRNAIQAEFK